MKRLLAAVCACALFAGCRPPVTKSMTLGKAQAGGPIVPRVATMSDPDPYTAGRDAALALSKAMGDTAPRLVLLAECFEDADAKSRVLRGVNSVLSSTVVVGGSTYGAFAQSGCLDRDAVALLGIGGAGVGVAAAFEPALGIAGLTLENDEALIKERLHAAGGRLARLVEHAGDDRLLIVIADAHSPKNAFLVEGIQSVLGKDFPITGGSVNKNAGQSFVYYQGRMHADAAVAVMLSGDFQVGLSGRQAKDNAKVIATAKDGAAEALGKVKGKKPFAVFAFNCAGRKGKLVRIEDELAAMQQALGKDVPVFGCYCAGEVGPADKSIAKPDTLSSGVGWHVMFSVLAR
jgi:hypothetical protein